VGSTLTFYSQTLDWTVKSLSGTNTLAYLASLSVTKKFYNIGPAVYRLPCQQTEESTSNPDPQTPKVSKIHRRIMEECKLESYVQKQPS